MEDIFWFFLKFQQVAAPLPLLSHIYYFVTKSALILFLEKVLILKQAHHISSAECLIFVVSLQIWKKNSDQGRESVNTINADFAKKIKIYRMITAAYHPQTNGLDER